MIESRRLYAILLKIKFENFLTTREFEIFLFEYNYEVMWGHLRESFKKPAPPELWDFNNTEVVDYEKVLFTFLTEISSAQDYAEEPVNYAFENLVLYLIEEYFEWKDYPVNFKKYASQIETLFGIEFRDKIVRLIKLDTSIVEKNHQALSTIAKIEGSINIPFPKQINNKNKNVFIVHGHDKVSRLELTRYIKDGLGLNPIVLQEQPDDDFQTVISKFEKLASQCSAALILFTPDDDSNGTKRARQNVVLELGYFMALFKGQNQRRIMVIKKGDLEIPSDISGVLYHSYQNEINESFYKLREQFKAWNYEIK